MERRTWSHWLLHPACRTGIARCVLPDTLLRCGTDGVFGFGPSWAGYGKALQQRKSFREQLLDHPLCLENRIKAMCSSFSAAFSPCDLAFCQVLCSPRSFPLLDLILPFVVVPFPSPCQHHSHFALSFLATLTFLVQVNWVEEMTEGLKLGTGASLLLLPLSTGVTKQHQAARESWDAPTKLWSQDRIPERQNLGCGESLPTPGPTVGFALSSQIQK